MAAVLLTGCITPAPPGGELFRCSRIAVAPFYDASGDGVYLDGSLWGVAERRYEAYLLFGYGVFVVGDIDVSGATLVEDLRDPPGFQDEADDSGQIHLMIDINEPSEGVKLEFDISCSDAEGETSASLVGTVAPDRIPAWEDVQNDAEIIFVRQ